MATLTKALLAHKLEEDIGVNMVQALKIVDAFFEEICAALERGEDVSFSKFGNFKLKAKKARPGRNPKTGEDKIISARKVVTFHPSNQLRYQVASLARKKR